MQQSLSGLGKNTWWLLITVLTPVSFMLCVFVRCVALASVTQVSRLQSADLIQCDSSSTDGSVSRCGACDWCVAGDSYL